MSLGNWGGVPHYLSAQEAAEQLGVSRRTLYVYVSRRLVRSIGSHSNKRYLEADISKLLNQNKLARRPRAAARHVLDWGLPVLESSITLIDDGRIYYRGIDATWLAAHETIENVAAILWGCAAFGDASGAAMAKGMPRARLTPMERICHRLAAMAGDASSADPVDLYAEGAHVIRNVYAAAAGCASSGRPLDQVLASGFGRIKAADVIRRAAILCADHELTPSAFSVRCAASTGANLAAALLAGVGTFHGAAQGGAVQEVEALVDECAARGAGRVVAERLASGQALPGFGHVLHPHGDCRGANIRAAIDEAAETMDVATAVRNAVGLEANNVFGLVAMRRALGLPREAAPTIYVCGRAIGWIAHAIEQRRARELIRPRAQYVGPRPRATQPAEVHPEYLDLLQPAFRSTRID